MANKKKIRLRRVPTETLPRDIRFLETPTGNIYKTTVVIGKRAQQIARNEKEELQKKLEEFAPSSDDLEEVFENKEQIEISTYYEKKPKPSLVAIQEFIHNKIQEKQPSRKNKGPENKSRKQ